MGRLVHIGAVIQCRCKKGQHNRFWGYLNIDTSYQIMPTRRAGVGSRPCNLVGTSSRACLGPLHAWNSQNWTARRYFVAVKAIWARFLVFGKPTKLGRACKTWVIEDVAVLVVIWNLVAVFSRAYVGALHAWNCENWSDRRKVTAVKATRIPNAYHGR